MAVTDGENTLNLILFVESSLKRKANFLPGAVKTTYAFSAFLTPFPSNFRFAWYQQAGEGGSYDKLAERYGERVRCFTLAPFCQLKTKTDRPLNLRCLLPTCGRLARFIT